MIINPDMIVHWMQLTAGSGVLQPWFLRDGWDEVERRMQPALDAGVTQFCWWCWDGWTVQSPDTTPREECWGKIPWIIVGDGRATQNAALRAIEDGFRERALTWRNRGITIYPYWGCPRYDAAIVDWLEGKRRDMWASIESQGRIHRGLPLMVDAMTAAEPHWFTLMKVLREKVHPLIILEGRAEPPPEWGWLFMHRDFEAERLPAVRASTCPWKGCLIRSDADLNGADRATRVRELVDAGVHVIIDSGTVL